MSADSDAFKTVQQLPGLTPAEQQYLITVARGEGFYGLGWGSPNAKTISESEQAGIDPKAGVGSNNWGAVQGTGSAGSFPHIDHHADGSVYVGKFKKYSSPVDGASDVARVLLKPNVKAALAKGDLRGAVFAQHANHYFELDPEKYLSSVKSNYSILTKALSWPVLLSDPPPVQGIIADLPLSGGSSDSDSLDTSSGEHSRPHVRLVEGMSGGEVRYLQSLLPGCRVDGQFGPKTKAFVIAFQNSAGLMPDGIVGLKTWTELEEGCNG